MNEAVIEAGTVFGKLLDYIIVKEDKDLRGRKKGEISKLIVNGLLKENINANYEVILDEKEGFIKAIGMAKKGDSIVVFFEEMESLVKIIEEYNEFYKDNKDIGYELLN